MIIKNILLTGKPGVGKTTVVYKLYHHLSRYQIAGFYTREIRNAGQREGFLITTFDGLEETLAHIKFGSSCKVGKYGVNLSSLSKIIAHLQAEIQKPDLWLIDEIGKMESLSVEFRNFINNCLQDPPPVVATISISAGGWIESIRQRKDIKLVEVNEKNRTEIPLMLREMLQKIIPQKHLN